MSTGPDHGMHVIGVGSSYGANGRRPARTRWTSRAQAATSRSSGGQLSTYGAGLPRLGNTIIYSSTADVGRFAA
ncbi:hypothetical protein [Nocardioides sp. zg-1230]|uniref:hypothetical protein n=1 Tax=Nocardioides sp. zg-1230 TaxID=2736601 RepID=UPI0015521607|nr:hypothetical protein [Nocardioides sp. zg-1230]NPC41677.1 hypothetical protein [Nocardioides sp. zg-1230]